MKNVDGAHIVCLVNNIIVYQIDTDVRFCYFKAQHLKIPGII